MHWSQAIVFGIVEGFTEFLPISSTAHLMLTEKLLGIISSNYVKTFNIAIQSGAILAVLALYWKSFLSWHLLKKIIVAFLPTGILGLLFYPVVKQFLGNANLVLWTLALGGIGLIVFERWHKEKEDAKPHVASLTYKQCLQVGCFQALAMVPGVSRAAATIIGGLLLNIRRSVIVEFSFLLAVPTMFAATGLDILKNYQEFSPGQFGVLFLGFITSFLMAMVSIKLLLSYIKNHTFTAFGIYRILLVFVFLGLAWLGLA